MTLSKNLLSLTALEEPAAEDRGLVQSHLLPGLQLEPNPCWELPTTSGINFAMTSYLLSRVLK